MQTLQERRRVLRAAYMAQLLHMVGAALEEVVRTAMEAAKSQPLESCHVRAEVSRAIERYGGGAERKRVGCPAATAGTGRGDGTWLNCEDLVKTLNIVREAYRIE